MGHFNKFQRGQRGDDFSGRGNRSMFSAVCDKCGERCEVPFKPSADRKVFCNQCFRAQRADGQKFISKTVSNANAAVGSRGQFDILNVKLDKILSILGQPKQAPMKVESAAKEDKVKNETVKSVKKEKAKVKKVKAEKK